MAQKIPWKRGANLLSWKININIQVWSISKLQVASMREVKELQSIQKQQKSNGPEGTSCPWGTNIESFVFLLQLLQKRARTWCLLFKLPGFFFFSIFFFAGVTMLALLFILLFIPAVFLCSWREMTFWNWVFCIFPIFIFSVSGPSKKERRRWEQQPELLLPRHEVR